MIDIPNAGDMDDGTICRFHPYRSNQGGICALCLQDKLRILVSSSSSSLFRSDFATAGYSASPSTKFEPENGAHYQDHHPPTTRIPFLSKKKKNPEVGFRRSKSTTTPARKFGDSYDGEVLNHKNKGWIWSLFDLSTKSHSSRKIDHSLRESSKIASLPTAGIVAPISVKRKEKYAFREFSGSGAAEEDVGGGGGDESPNSSQATASVSSFEQKVSRSRSVGCGSRSFSGDLFERIAGFGDCTLRRVESHREGKPRTSSSAIAAVQNGGDGGGDCLKERVKCGGIFSGFTIPTSSSSSSTSSTYWVSSYSGEEGRLPPATAAPPYGQGRSKNRGWAFPSPRRGSSKGKRESSDKNSSTPNLDAIPSLLPVRI